jgi:hypothetical protein
LSLPRDVRDDVVGSLAVAMIENEWGAEETKQKVREFINAHYRQFAKFGPLSLDTPLFDGGRVTLADTVTRGLWD